MVFIETVGFLVELEALHPAGLSGLVSVRRLLGARETPIFRPSFTEYRQEKIKKYEGVSYETLI